MITGKYKELYEKLQKTIPQKRMLHDSLSTIAFGTDASFYRLIPKLVIKAYNEEEVRAILENASLLNIPVTFRAAGTSLSGQAISDSVLVITTHGWERHEILEDGAKIKLEPGIRGFRANGWLAPYGRKIGPDPASIDSAMIGGIAANNASGMCCGTSENSYKTIADIRVILPDGTLLDTSETLSVEKFKSSHLHLLNSLENIAKRIDQDETLRDRIKRKYKIKNTTGYSLNAFVDFSDGIDILKHLIIGSEGTLAFISGITYHTVIEHKHKALALIVYPTIEDACKAVMILKKQPVSAVELLDRAAIKSVEETPGVPQFLKTISSEACAILVETRAANKENLIANTEKITSSIKDITPELPYLFTDDAHEQATLWKVRKETLPTVAGMRNKGTTAIIEDICFPVQMLAQATSDLRKVFVANGYDDAVIFGHALEGNLHFMFNQNFNSEAEVERYSKFMNDIAELVVAKYDGSLKAEHGTGRNMAPFVEKEWGSQAYALMKEVKDLFDPKGIMNPGVILNNDPNAHIKDLKPIPATRELIDKCMECGFCEGTCVAEGLTLSPRQRVATFREMEYLKASGKEPHRAAEIQKLYQYSALDTCATDSLCALKCPVKVDTGKLVKELRHEGHSKSSERIAMFLANHMAGLTSFARIGLNMLHAIRLLFGKRIFGALAHFMRTITLGLIPLWNEHFPKGAHKIKITPIDSNSKRDKIVYFPSCITRSMGVSKSYSKELELTRLTEKLLKKAGYDIIYPENMNSLCCGMAFSSKGFVEEGKKLSDQLEAALMKASNNGEYPILCDMSPCLYTMHTNMDGKLKLYEQAEFTEKFLLNRLKITPIREKVAIFTVCTTKKLAVDETLVNIAKHCASDVIRVDSNCCGFAGDRGFLLPELNAHGLRYLKEQVFGCTYGYATSRTCEIGLSYHSGLEFKSILYLVDQCSAE